MLEAPTLSPTAPPTGITRLDLFTGYLKIGLLGFGGVAPWSRKVTVEERRWLSDEDYAAVLGFGQDLPGANAVNAAVIIGDRFHGVTGSLIAVAALLAAPLAILVALASLYDRFAADPDVRAALSGIAAGAAGLVIGTGIKMAVKLKPDRMALLLGGTVLAAVAAYKVSLIATVLILAPLGVALSLLRRPA